jgi:transcriptional regulator with XRE-family HTH domain
MSYPQGVTRFPMLSTAVSAQIVGPRMSRQACLVTEPEGAPTNPDAPPDLGVLLRGLRRAADFSQRELANRSGVPLSTISRLEAGKRIDALFSTVVRLARAAGAQVLVADADGNPVPEIPHEQLSDDVGRHYPAHLDVRPVRTDADWWGCWWSAWYSLGPERWAHLAPLYSFDLSRESRDYRRESPPDR